MSKLGVNIDHVATLRNARGENHPNILKFADIAINSGADSITVHLREDRRHIRDSDLKKIYDTLRKTAKNYVRLVALKHKFDFYGLYTGDIIKTITLCGEEYEKMALTMNDLSKQREVI